MRNRYICLVGCAALVVVKKPESHKWLRVLDVGGGNGIVYDIESPLRGPTLRPILPSIAHRVLL